MTEPADPRTFDENSLRRAIVGVWGAHGAHVDVFDHMLRLAADRDAAVEAERERCIAIISEIVGTDWYRERLLAALREQGETR